MKNLRLLWKIIVHFLCARNTGGHGIHSPFLFRFTQNVIREKNPYYVFPIIESLREKLKSDHTEIHFKDYGTRNDRTEKVSHIAKTSLKSPKWAQLLYRAVCFTEAKSVLELGTSLGITTCYLASSDKELRCVTLEGCEAVAEIARKNFEKTGIQNVEVIVGNIDNTLYGVLCDAGDLDLVFFDANHKKESVLKYFELCVEHIHSDTVFIVDDIHWSTGMEEAWNEIRKHQKVSATIDLFELGIVFFNKQFAKKTFKMRM